MSSSISLNTNQTGSGDPGRGLVRLVGCPLSAEAQVLLDFLPVRVVKV